jgi:hypothetical protein
MAQRVQFPSPIGGDPYGGPAVGGVSTGPGYSVDGFIVSPPPGAALDGTIQPLDQGFDPYADPQAGGPLILPPDDYAAGDPSATGIQPSYLIQGVRFEYAFLRGDDATQDLEMHDLDLNTTIAIPFWYNAAPLLVTPGFAVHYFEGPQTNAATGMADLPPRVYDAYLELGWQPKLTQFLSADLAFRTGVWSDFEFFNSHSIRLLGRGLAIITFSENISVAAGAVYLDRNNVKLLPAGGLIWTPNDDTRFEILFPNPKLARRFTTVGNTDLWWYVSGEYGGGAWTIERLSGAQDRIDYNDIRVSLGIESVGYRGHKTWFEVGYVFEREVDYIDTPTVSYEPRETIMLRAGIAW